MKKNIIGIMVSIILCIIVIQYLEVRKFEENYGIVFTYLSIIIGFVITSVTIIGSSPYSKFLYMKQDQRDNSKTLLHELLNSFKFTLFFYSIPMLLIIINTIIPWNKWNCIFRDIYTTIVLIITIWTFPILYAQLQRILKFIIQNAKRLKD